MKEKGALELTSSTLAIVIFVVVCVGIIILIWLSLTRDAPGPISEFFFRLFDYATSFGG